MAIPIWPDKTGQVFIRNFDKGIMDSIGAVPDPYRYIVLDNKKIPDPCYKLTVGEKEIPVYFSNPEQAFKNKIFPFITVLREDLAPAPSRWMGGAQLEYKYSNPNSGFSVEGVSGYLEKESKYQAYPYDMTYTISCWDRYEGPSQDIIHTVLRALPPVGRLIVYDSLNLMRTYEYYHEGSLVPLVELLDPSARAMGFALTIRVEGELDLQDPFSNTAVTGFDLFLYRQKN